MKKKEDYRGWALCCIAREIQRAWAGRRNNIMGRIYVNRLELFEDFSPSKRYFWPAHMVVRQVIVETKHSHWPGKAAMIRELKRQLDEYTSKQNA